MLPLLYPLPAGGSSIIKYYAVAVIIIMMTVMVMMTCGVGYQGAERLVGYPRHTTSRQPE
jgi:hypothetical protein